VAVVERDVRLAWYWLRSVSVTPQQSCEAGGEYAALVERFLLATLRTHYHRTLLANDIGLSNMC
jgi:hypothetical protein